MEFRIPHCCSRIVGKFRVRSYNVASMTNHQLTRTECDRRNNSPVMICIAPEGKGDWDDLLFNESLKR